MWTIFLELSSHSQGLRRGRYLIINIYFYFSSGMQDIKLFLKTQVHFQRGREFGERYPVNKEILDLKCFKLGQTFVDTTVLEIGRELGMKWKCEEVDCPGIQTNSLQISQIEILHKDTLKNYFYRILELALDSVG